MHALTEHIKRFSLILTFILVAFVVLVQPYPRPLNPDSLFIPQKSVSDDLLMKTLEDLMGVNVVYLSDSPSEYMIDELLNKSIEDLMNIKVGYSS
ncbi:MAG: hypothetical protein JW804_01965 [Sedimentisphaerales bacterium]|nr:hypothetical protein [Sedimentisphaerales bacterium]